MIKNKYNQCCEQCEYHEIYFTNMLFCKYHRIAVDNFISQRGCYNYIKEYNVDNKNVDDEMNDSMKFVFTIYKKIKHIENNQNHKKTLNYLSNCAKSISCSTCTKCVKVNKVNKCMVDGQYIQFKFQTISCDEYNPSHVAIKNNLAVQKMKNKKKGII